MLSDVLVDVRPGVSTHRCSVGFQLCSPVSKQELSDWDGQVSHHLGKAGWKGLPMDHLACSSV